MVSHVCHMSDELWQIQPHDVNLTIGSDCGEDPERDDEMDQTPTRQAAILQWIGKYGGENAFALLWDRNRPNNKYNFSLVFSSPSSFYITGHKRAVGLSDGKQLPPAATLKDNILRLPALCSGLTCLVCPQSPLTTTSDLIHINYCDNCILNLAP